MAGSITPQLSKPSRFRRGSHRKMLKALKAGAKSRCPFCIIKTEEPPKVGDHVRIVAGPMLGKTGIVMEPPASLPPDYIILGSEHGPSDVQLRVNLERDLVQRLPERPPPDWALPISLKYAAELDELIVYFCDKSFDSVDWVIDWRSFYDIMIYCWNNNLPIKPEELWGILQAHGVPTRLSDEIQDFYQKASDLLIRATRRKPFKNRRVKPLSLH